MYVTDQINNENDADGALRRRAGESIPGFGRRLMSDGVDVDEAHRRQADEWTGHYAGARAAASQSPAPSATSTAADAMPEVIGGRSDWMESTRRGTTAADGAQADAVIGGRADWLERVLGGE
jgi:hypothetical protein